ncbi:MAG: YCF48-related protein, partial [Pyrinomonadaceae bacterium]
MNTKIMPQMRSLSVSGLTHASLIADNTRDLILSTDGGKTWQVIPSAAVADTFECATWLDDKRGWAVNHQGHVFASHSGGAIWTKISELRDFTGANQIEFVNENDGWIREFLSIWRTRDGGATWHKTLSTVTPGVAGQPTSLFPLSANIVVSSGSGGQVYVTKDGGETWRIETPLAGTNIE